jgi:glycosyltransferase involved in cell wall biosynthesis
MTYAFEAARPVIAAAKDSKASIIQAASNHVNALPALLAAKKLNIPFYYEMRGLWELSRASRQPGYQLTQSYLQGLELEGLVASQADRVLIISERLAQYAQERWRIPAERFFLLPNCADQDLKPAEKNEVEPRSVGYAGSFIVYEGLDILLEALARLRDRNVYVSLKLIGDGETRKQLEDLTQTLNLSDQVRFYGRVPLETARDLLRSCSLVCIPRRPFEVCSLVPPIKLVEAMVLGKAVVVPDLPVFRDELGDSGGGWFFTSGDTVSLAETIASALDNPVALAEAGKHSRLYSLEHRNWSKFATKLFQSCNQGE